MYLAIVICMVVYLHSTDIRVYCLILSTVVKSRVKSRLNSRLNSRLKSKVKYFSRTLSHGVE